jgi:hypothetical protein
MSGAQDRSTGMQSGAQGAQRAAGNVPGGNAPRGDAPGGNVPRTTAGNVTGATSTSLHDQPASGTEPTASYPRGTSTTPSHRAPMSGTGTHGGGLGGIISIVAGAIAFLAGLSAVVKQSFYHALPGYAYRWNVRAWGWVLLILGGLLLAAGVSALLGIRMARAVGVGLAVLTAVIGFLFLAYTPIWGTIVVALSVFAIWGLLRGDRDSEDVSAGSMEAGSTRSMRM